jgi:mannose-6-phosphate isomerase-like protein (cupin superfamily)
MAIRRVVTGHTAAGRAVFVSDSEVAPITVMLTPGLAIHNIWGADAAPLFPDDGSMPEHSTYFAPVGGFRFGLIEIPPDSVKALPDLDVAAGAAEMERKLPGLAARFEPDHPGMHRTDTVDFQYVVSGEVWLELDDAAQVLLRAGDTIIQNGTRHVWHNRGRVPCQMVFGLVGARRPRN